MANEKKEKQARLSAYGLASFVKVVDTVDYAFYISEKDKKVKLKAYINPHTQRKGVIYLKSNYTRENIQEYINNLYTIFNKIPIKDKDKVFFSKNSTFPRTMFNRYSKDAKRVEIIDNASKIVLESEPIKFEYPYYSVRGIILEFGSYVIKIDKVDFVNKLTNLTNIGTDKELSTIINRGTPWRSHETYEQLIQVFEKRAKEDNVHFDNKINELNFYTIPDKITFDLLTKNIPLGKFTTDKQVNKYIDSKKEELTEENMAFLGECIGSKDEKNVVLGLKLMENLSILNNKIRSYVVFLKAVANSSDEYGQIDSRYGNRRNLSYNNIFKGVGSKNVLNMLDLETTSFNSYTAVFKRIVDTCIAEDSKEFFKYVIKDRKLLKAVIASQIGIRSQHTIEEFQAILNANKV